MPWNEPGDSGKNKDPWTGRPKQTPPDLEAFLRDLYKKIVALFKLRTLNKKSVLAHPFLLVKLNAKTIGLISIFGLLIWFALGFYKVNRDESAVVTRFAVYDSTVGPGYHWIFKPFQHYTIINSGKINKLSTHVTLLTRDENKIQVNLNIDYSIVNPRHFLFASIHPLSNLQETLDDVINQVFSQYTLNQLLTTSHFALAERLQKQLQSVVKMQTGLAVKNIELLSIQLPEQLQAVFTDAANAKNDKEQLEKLANIYAMQIKPRAQLSAQRLIADAKAYQQEIVLKAKTDIIHFLALLPAYEASPTLTKKRLYLAALQTLMVQSNKLQSANNADSNSSLTLDPFTKTTSVNTDKLTATVITNNDKKAQIDNNNPSNKINNSIPSSYNISGGYE
ncbi:MAG: FtsH protease activity modulator HflK [Gammaproteobacteria bacterium]|nr:MAG: FtsH protease activity modulator HflK [Gammaproteobacteria bacterium]